MREIIRADRLIQALLLLQGRPQITAADLARELEVSVPTARRDLEALAMSGVPIYPTRGRGGGWRLIGGARTDLTGLTEGEVTSLLVGLTQNPVASPERTAAMRKLTRAIPAAFRESAQRVADATVRDIPWGESSPASVTDTVATLQRAIADERQVRIGYDGAKRRVVRQLVPLVVGSRGVHWYLLAAPAGADSHEADVDRLRTYRVDRITSASELEAPGAAPDGFQPSEAWSAMVGAVEDLRGTVRATVRVEQWAVRALCDRFGAQARVLDAADVDGSGALVDVRAQNAAALAEQLASWASVSEVIEPEQVRAELRLLGERIVATYPAQPH